MSADALIIVEILKMPGWRGRGNKEECSYCVADDLWVFVIGDREGGRTAAIEPGKLLEMVTEDGRTSMAAWRRE